MARLNIERQQLLEPTRIEYAVKRIEELGYEVIHRDSQMIKFVHKGHPVCFYPYSGWATGKTITVRTGITETSKTATTWVNGEQTIKSA